MLRSLSRSSLEQRIVLVAAFSRPVDMFLLFSLRQRFRIKIEPVDADLATRYPCLSQLTAPLKSVTKLNAAGRAVAGATSSVAVAANTPHSGGANATGIPDYTGLRSLQDLDTSSSLVASLPRPTMPPLGHLPPPPLARSSSHTSTSVQTGFAEPTFDLEAVSQYLMTPALQLCLGFLFLPQCSAAA